MGQLRPEQQNKRLQLEKVAFTKVFKNQLHTMHSALTHLSMNLSAMGIIASFPALRLALEENLEDTLRQIKRIEEISKSFKHDNPDKNSFGVTSVLNEMYSAISQTKKKSFERDMALISYMHIIKHIEIAAYRTLRTAASKLGYDEAKVLLTENMDEAKENDRLFVMISIHYQCS